MARIAAQEGIVEGAIANVVLRLTFADEAKVKNVLALIRATNLGGASDLTKKDRYPQTFSLSF